MTTFGTNTFFPVRFEKQGFDLLQRTHTVCCCCSYFSKRSDYYWWKRSKPIFSWNEHTLCANA